MIVDQTEFTCALLDPKQATPAGLTGPDGGPAGKRFDVYRNNVVVSLLDAMETAFPAVQKLVGAKFFRAISGIFVRKHPPTSPLLMFYGDSFPEFLTSFEPVAKLGYLPDVARLELARRASYHAADSAAVLAQAFADIAPDTLMNARFKVSSAMQIFASRYPVASIWEFNMNDGAAKPEPVGETVLITRPQLDLDMVVISDSNAAFLKHIQSGQTLSVAYDTLTGRDSEFDLSAAISLMMNREIITKISL